MKIIGLTGSIAMGKSNAARMLRRMGYPIFDADDVVRLFTTQKGVALPSIKEAFPDIFHEGQLVRSLLAELVFKNPSAKKRLEMILHPLVAQAREKFFQQHRVKRSPIVFLDIPLLFENKLEKICDAVIVMTSPSFLQRIRALQRPGMTRELLENILSTQMPDAEKKKRADRIVQSGLGKAYTWRQLKKIAQELQNA